MSWREFAVLLSGLSLESRWYGALAHDNDPNAVRTIEDRDEGVAFFESIR